MKWVFGLFIIVSTIFAVINGKLSELTQIVLTEGSNSVKLILMLAGSICWWSGIMRIMEKSGLNSLISRAIYPITSRIFSGLGKDSNALQSISLNISANLLGLGNAATPLGIKAMSELSKEEKSKGNATNNMVLLVVLNTASIQIIPTTIAMLRAKAGASQPLDILPLVLISSVCALFVGVSFAKIIEKITKKSTNM
jgi:spore maturation protein A